MNQSRVVSHEQWLEARKRLLIREKELTHRADALAEERRQLPWERVNQDYVFEGPEGKVSLSQMFGPYRQLAVYHFMLGSGWGEGCPVCSLVADHLNGLRVHLAAREVALTLVSRAPYREIAAFKQRMGWQLDWVSSNGNAFNRDYHVSFNKEELASGAVSYNYATNAFVGEESGGVSIFAKGEAAEVFHTYSAYARGGEVLLGIYGILDLLPNGRNEEGLPWPTAWVRHHDKYALPSAAE